MIDTKYVSNWAAADGPLFHSEADGPLSAEPSDPAAMKGTGWRRAVCLLSSIYPQLADMAQQ